MRSKLKKTVNVNRVHRGGAETQRKEKKNKRESAEGAEGAEGSMPHSAKRRLMMPVTVTAEQPVSARGRDNWLELAGFVNANRTTFPDAVEEQRGVRGPGKG
jgi:hypothetical protein